ncbi:MAG: gamma-glutamyltransferase family protein [Desulfurococcaceae archaeon TW002]
MFRVPFYSSEGVVASETALASCVGVKVLELGGNAVDASVAVSLMLSVNIPHLGGLGGDFFALIKDPQGRITFINGSGYAPAKMTAEFIKTLGLKEVPLEGPLSIVVPGMIDGLRVMWEKLGSLEWRRILDLVINSVKKGFSISPSFATALNNFKDLLIKDAGSRKTYYSYTQYYVPGQLVRFDNIVKALDLIKENPRHFYEGDIAVKISEYVKSLGGVISYEDMRNYKASIEEPIKLNLDKITVYEMPPNTQGITTLQLLKLLEEERVDKPNSISRLRMYVDLFKTVYKLRDLYVGDSRYMSVKIDELLSIDLLRNSSSEQRRSLHIDGDTTYFAIIDREGTIVSGIQSLFYPFGSKITEPTYGITLNSRASSFNLIPNHPNSLAPLKKPLHTLSAMIVLTDDREIALGLSGGHFRPQLHAEIFQNMFKYGMNPQEAIEYPRFIWYPGTNIIEFEEGFEKGVIEGYTLREVKYPSRLGVAAAAEIRGGVKASYVDIRGDGLALGLLS